MARPKAAVLRGVIAAIATDGPMTLRQLLAVVRVDCGSYDRAATLCELRVALSNGLRTGRRPLECAGRVRVAHCSRWCVLYGVREAVQGVTEVARPIPNIDAAALQASAALRDFGQTILAWRNSFRPA